MKRRRRSSPILRVVVLCVGVTASTQVLAKIAPDDPQATVQSLVRELDLQTRMPERNAREPSEPPSDIKLTALPGAKIILWGAIAAAILFALWALRDYFPGFSRRSRQKAPATVEDASVVAATDRMVQTGDEADAMAASGRLAEAMHMLLLRSLVEVRHRLGVDLANSLTSREILARLSLPGDGREALGDLVGRVEFVHFGARTAAAGDYAACRASYERLITAMSSGAAPGPTPTPMAA